MNPMKAALYDALFQQQHASVSDPVSSASRQGDIWVALFFVGLIVGGIIAIWMANRQRQESRMSCQAGDREGGVDHLRAVDRLNGQDWDRVRMSQLRIGDIFRIEEVVGDFVATEAPTMDLDGVWGVLARATVKEE